MPPRNTLAFHTCAGCDAPLGLQLLPWAGVPFAPAQGLCTPCGDQIRATVARDLAETRRRADGAPAPPA